MFKRFTISAAIAAAACAGAVGAQAEDIHLKFGDLDLTQPAQVRVLDGRITQNAKAWCADQVSTGTRLASSRCERDARDALIAAMPAAAQKAYRSGMAAPVSMVQAAIPAQPPTAR